MKFKFLSVLILVSLFLNQNITCLNKEKNETNSKESIGELALSTLASLLAPIAVGGIQSLTSFLNSLIFSDYKDTIMFNRMVRIKECGDNNCIQITDKQSGFMGKGTGSSKQEALGDATQQLFEELLQNNLLSLFDLCDLHITFPHPNQEQCKNVQINPCDLMHPIVTIAPAPCEDKLIGSYCTVNRNRCGVLLYQTFMHSNCFKTCTNGTCKLISEQVNIDPCALSFK